MEIVLQKVDTKTGIEDALIYNESHKSTFYVSTDNLIVGSRRVNVNVSFSNGKYFLDDIPVQLDFEDLPRKDFIAKYK